MSPERSEGDTEVVEGAYRQSDGDFSWCHPQTWDVTNMARVRNPYLNGHIKVAFLWGGGEYILLFIFLLFSEWHTWQAFSKGEGSVRESCLRLRFNCRQYGRVIPATGG